MKRKNYEKELLRLRYDYSEEKGGLINKIEFNWKNKVGERIGYIHSRGYVHVNIKGMVYKEHILVWNYFNGDVPNDMQIDHIDGNRSNNRIENLRICSSFDNQHNRKKNKNNTSGYKGVTKVKNRWTAEIMCNSTKHRLGIFDTKELAAIAWNEASIKLHGVFAHQNEIK